MNRQNTIYKKDGLTIFISLYTLNDSQRMFAALKEKEDKGYWTGSIATDAYTLVHLLSKPTRGEVIKQAIDELKFYGVEATEEEFTLSHDANPTA